MLRPKVCTHVGTTITPTFTMPLALKCRRGWNFLLGLLQYQGVVKATNVSKHKVASVGKWSSNKRRSDRPSELIINLHKPLAP